MSGNKEESGLSQPAKAVVIQLFNETDSELCEHLVQALSEFFCVICSMSCSSRVVFFGIVAVGPNNKIQVVLPLQHTRSNFNRIHAALNDLSSLSKEWFLDAGDEQMLGDGKYNGSLRLGVDECVNMFRRQAFGLLQAAGYWSQLEVFVFGTNISSTYMKEMNRIGRTLDNQLVRSLQVVHVMCADNDLKPQDSASQSSMSETMNSCFVDVDDICDLIETKTVKMNRISLQRYFLSWLHEATTDLEYLHLNFLDSGLSIKCDIKECMINPACFGSFYQCYNLSAADSASKIIAGGGGNKAWQHRTIVEIDVVSRVPVDGVCDSVIFGIPLVVQATSCWKMDWDDLEINRRNFLALCHLLSERKEALIVKLSQESSRQQHRGAASNKSKLGPKAHAQELPRGCFVLLPSSRRTLLIKSIVGQEMLLPLDFPLLEIPPQENLSLIVDSLERIEQVNAYNPLNYSTELHSCLSSQLLPNHQKQKRGADSSMVDGGLLKRVTPGIISAPSGLVKRIPSTTDSSSVPYRTTPVGGVVGFSKVMEEMETGNPRRSFTERWQRSDVRSLPPLRGKGSHKLMSLNECLLGSEFPTEL